MTTMRALILLAEGIHASQEAIRFGRMYRHPTRRGETHVQVTFGMPCVVTRFLSRMFDTQLTTYLLVRNSPQLRQFLFLYSCFQVK